MDSEIEKATQDKWNILMAVALLEDLYLRGEITERTFTAIKKDAKDRIEKLAN